MSLEGDVTSMSYFKCTCSIPSLLEVSEVQILK